MSLVNESDPYIYHVNFIWLLRYRFMFICINFTEKDCVHSKRMIILCN